MKSIDTTIQDKPKRAGASTSTERRTTGRGKPAIGRYDGRSHNTRLPGEGLGKLPVSANSKDAEVVAAVEDPWGDGKQRVFATVNRRVDILEDERSHKLISEAAYRTGRQVQQVFELAARVGGSNWGGDSRSDPLHTQRSAISKAMERAGEILEMERRIRDRLGAIDTRLLARVLRDRMSFADCAALVGKPGSWGERFIKARFRDALEELAEAWTAKGKGQPVPDDKHKAAAATAATREAASITLGVSADRREAEVEAEAAANRKSALAPVRRAPGTRKR